MAELVQLSGQTGTNVLVMLNDQDAALVMTALNHLVENFGSGEISRRPSLFGIRKVRRSRCRIYQRKRNVTSTGRPFMLWWSMKQALSDDYRKTYVPSELRSARYRTGSG